MIIYINLMYLNLNLIFFYIKYPIIYIVISLSV